MIPYVHEHSQFATKMEIFLCTLTFLNISFFFIESTFLICFDNLFQNPYISLIVVTFTIMGVDILAGFYFSYKSNRTIISPVNILNLIIMGFLLASFLVQNKIIIYFSGCVLLRLPEIFQYNNIIKIQLKGKFPILFKLYVIVKITYAILLFSHINAGIFYAIDQHLIYNQYYGPFSQNPNLYYQGTMKCFTPIYQLDEIWRYVYALYYLVSLIATVAFGDIIPHNPIEDAYVIWLLVFSTISIAIIIEQMTIMFRNQQIVLYRLIRRIKYLNYMLRQAKISSRIRRQINRFSTYSFFKRLKWEPQIQRLSNQLASKLLLSPIPQTSYFFTHTHLPYLINRYLVNFTEVKFYTQDQTILDNFNASELENQNSILRILSNGKISMGYGPNMSASKIVSEKGTLIGWTELLWKTKSVHPYVVIKTITSASFYQIKRQHFFKPTKKVSTLTEKDRFVEIEHALFIFERVCMDKSRELFLGKYNICQICKVEGHFPYTCPLTHYQPPIPIHQISRNNSFKRYNLLSRKVIQTKIINIKNKHFGKNDLDYFIERKQIELDHLCKQINGNHRSKLKDFEGYKSYRIFYPQFNF